MGSTDIKCPGGEIVHPVLSRNKDDVQCRLDGGLRPAAGSRCCDDYYNCPIWKTAKDVEKRLDTRRRAELQAKPHNHVLSGRHDREVIRT